MAETVEWISAAGTVTPLNVEYAVRGRWAPPAVVVEESVPGQAGARVREVSHGVREFVLPLRVRTSTEAELRVALRTLVREMDPRAGAGRIRVYTPAGDAREIRCLYSAGLDLDETQGQTSMPTWQRTPAVFRAHDPYWYATSDISEVFTVGAVAPFFPILPIRLSSSEVFVDATVTNGGDLETWPVWTITGPGSSIRLLDLTAGLSTSLTSAALGAVTLGAGEKVEIDTRPGFKTVTRLSDGANLWPYLSTDSALWPLRIGASAVRVEMSGATADSSVTVSHRPRYLTP
jgi:hypothetical protein